MRLLFGCRVKAQKILDREHADRDRVEPIEFDLQRIVDRGHRLEKDGCDTADDEDDEDQIELMVKTTGGRRVVHQRIDFLPKRSARICLAELLYGRDEVSQQLQETKQTQHTKRPEIQIENPKQMQPVRSDDEDIDQRKGRNRKSKTCKTLTLVTRIATRSK